MADLGLTISFSPDGELLAAAGGQEARAWRGKRGTRSVRSAVTSCDFICNCRTRGTRGTMGGWAASAVLLLLLVLENEIYMNFDE